MSAPLASTSVTAAAISARSPAEDRNQGFGRRPHGVPALLARVENLEVEVRRRAKVVVNERTGNGCARQRRPSGGNIHSARQFFD